MIRRPRITKRRIAFLIGAWAVIVGASLALTAWQVRQGDLRELGAEFPLWPAPGRGQTIVVFAPHCDDETLGAGGLMRQAAASGADVRVVLMTNGDGFRYAAALDAHSLRPRPRYFVEFGYRRQRETFAALRRLGVPADHVITLGYPDRGLEPMWTSNWNTPYTSRYTRDSRSPYANSFTPRAPYTGSQLLSDLKRLLRDINPDEIYIPHPDDQHADHWATSVFVTEALCDLGWLGKKTVGLYLVHRGDWPVPQGLHENARLAPPAKLADMDTTWYQFPLEPESLEAKRAAIEEFRSQGSGPRRFLRSFVRENELFGTRPSEAHLVRSWSIRVDGKVADWKGIEPVIRDPEDDNLLTHSRPAADLGALYVAEDSDRLYFRIAVRGPVNGSTIYELRVHPVGDPNGTTLLMLRRGRRVPTGWNAAFGRRDIEASCALGGWRGRPLVVAAVARVRMYGIWYQGDRSAYRVLIP